MDTAQNKIYESTFGVSGMTCMGCVAKVKQLLETDTRILSALPDLEAAAVLVRSSKKMTVDDLNKIAGQQDRYTFQNTPLSAEDKNTDELPEVSWRTYKPLLLIIGFILLVSVAVQFPFQEFSWMLLMRHFMAGFFITFSFFKLLNLEGFAMSYQMYDVIARAWSPWAFIYPFIELILGLFYLTDFFPFYTNIATIIILGTASIGVIQSNLRKRKIKCACLGDVFNLPMSTVTVIEDVLMVLMALVMLILY